MNALTASPIDAFLTQHRLPAAFRRVIIEHYQPLADWLAQSTAARPEIVGISGAQGTGKSTLADFLRASLRAGHGWSVAVLSLDDFYLTRAQRVRLGRTVHPLLRTRGAPGTHDVELCRRCLTELEALGAGETLALPRFDKATDDRAPADAWPTVSGPIDLIVLEGWCLAIEAQDAASLAEPVNALEATHDPDATWRTHVNDQLRERYATLFRTIGKLVFLKAPDFEAVYRWRREQERKLAEAAGGSGSALMDDAQIAEFLQHYERLTRAAIEKLPALADVTLELDRSHQVTRSLYRREAGARP